MEHAGDQRHRLHAFGSTGEHASGSKGGIFVAAALSFARSARATSGINWLNTSAPRTPSARGRMKKERGRES